MFLLRNIHFVLKRSMHGDTASMVTQILTCRQKHYVPIW